MDTLYQGDCLDFMQTINDNFIDLTLTSPPYDDLRTYNGYHFDFESIAKQLYRITKQGGVVVWVVADKTKDGNESGTSFRQALYFKEIGFNLFDTMIWEKPAHPVGSIKAYYQSFEYMFVFTKGKIKTYNLIKDRENLSPGEFKKRKTRIGRHANGKKTDAKLNESINVSEYGKRINIWKYNTGSFHSTKDKVAFQHPAIFPEKLAEDHILSWTNPNDLVFDPMCGSGTTGKMALLNNRKFIGVDISQDYISIAKERIGLLNHIRA